MPHHVSIEYGIEDGHHEGEGRNGQNLLQDMPARNIAGGNKVYGKDEIGNEVRKLIFMKGDQADEKDQVTMNLALGSRRCRGVSR